MPRAIWSGSISFGLVNIPVKLFTAVSRKTVRFNQIDSATGARVRQKRISAADGAEVPYERIVKGYELPTGDFVTITDEEMAARVRRKQELLRERQLGLIKGTDLPPDYNPEAGANLRAKSIGQNLKESLEKQKELKQRKPSLKRDDLCEMLGRGC